MSVKDQFSDTDWKAVLQAPMLAGLAVTASDPGGLIGAVQESAAVAGQLKSVADEGGETLPAAIAEDMRTSEGRSAVTTDLKPLVSGKSPEELSQAAIARVDEVAGIVDRSAPAHGPGFRAFLLETAQKVAEAAKEGGFLGFGGEAVSDAEQAALDALRARLLPAV